MARPKESYYDRYADEIRKLALSSLTYRKVYERLTRNHPEDENIKEKSMQQYMRRKQIEPIAANTKKDCMLCADNATCGFKNCPYENDLIDYAKLKKKPWSTE